MSIILKTIFFTYIVCISDALVFSYKDIDLQSYSKKIDRRMFSNQFENNKSSLKIFLSEKMAKKFHFRKRNKAVFLDQNFCHGVNIKRYKECLENDYNDSAQSLIATQLYLLQNFNIELRNSILDKHPYLVTIVLKKSFEQIKNQKKAFMILRDAGFTVSQILFIKEMNCHLLDINEG